MYSILPIFPTVILSDSYNGNLFDEYVLCRQLETDTSTEGVLVSKNKNILNLPQMAKIKHCLQNAINSYTKDVMQYDSEAYITESWISIQPKGISLQSHTHPDSFISGVMYFTNEGDVPIVFESIKQNVQPSVKTPSPFNSRTWKISGEKGGYILFPSYLTHSVEQNTHDMDRMALSFNTSIRNTNV
jgi:uncharacterized protein (TIGR02466 family)